MESNISSESMADNVVFNPPPEPASDVSPELPITRQVAFAGLAAASVAIKEVDSVDADENNTAGISSASGADNEGKRSGALSAIASLISRRKFGDGVNQGQGSDSSPAVVPSIQDVRKFVFQVSRSDKRIMGGLRAHTFSSQAFFSSFAVGLAIGSIVAILLRIISEIGVRILPFHSK